jgi:hypothetical protein
MSIPDPIPPVQRDPRTLIYRRLCREGHANFARPAPEVGTLQQQLAKARGEPDPYAEPEPDLADLVAAGLLELRDRDPGALRELFWSILKSNKEGRRG